MKASQPQKLTYRLHDEISPFWAVHRSARAKALHGFHSTLHRRVTSFSRYLRVSPDVDAEDRLLSLQCLPSYRHLLATAPRHMLWDLRYVSGYTPPRRQPYRSVELVTFAPVHAFFLGIFRNRNGNSLTIIRHRNEFNPAVSRCFNLSHLRAALTITRHRNEFNPAASRCTY